MTSPLEKAKARYEAEARARDIQECKDYYTFFRRAWRHVDPAPFTDNWHLGYIAEHLEAVYRGEIKELAINVPPGTGKSKEVSVCFTPWIWLQDPTYKVLSTSYASGLADRDARASRELMQSPWYTSRWGMRLEDRGSDNFYRTLKGGYRMAAGTNTAILGWHFNMVIIDDPNDPKETNPDNFAKIINWKRNVLASRRVDPANFKQILIMQRVHDLDMAAYCIEEEGFQVVRIPMRRAYSIESQTKVDARSQYRDPRVDEGTLLWPERYPESVVKHMETVQMGPSVASAQLQQDPVPAGGAIFSLPGVSQTYDQLPDGNWFMAWYQSWDFAVKSKEENDFVSGQVWLVNWPKLYLVDRVHRRMGFVESLAAMDAMSSRWPRSIANILIEDKANGSPIIEVAKAKFPGVLAIEPEGDKVARAYSVQGIVNGLNIFTPTEAALPGIVEWRKEMTRFPKAKNDDDVDATVQLIRHVMNNGHLLATAGKWGKLPI